MQEGGPATAFERFIRLVATDANWERLDPRVRQRMLASAGTYFEKTTRTPGTHFAYLDHPDELAQTVRLFLSEVSDCQSSRSSQAS